MAKQNNPQLNIRNSTVTKITDKEGNTILEIGLHEYTVRLSDGSRVHRRINETIQLVCGTMWNPGLIEMAKILIGVCEQCRQTTLFGRRTHGLVSIHMAKICTDCGTLCCPGHRKLGRDKKWRCLKHHKTHLLKTFFRPIFFERKDD
jgi:hypothetical protein